MYDAVIKRKKDSHDSSGVWREWIRMSIFCKTQEKQKPKTKKTKKRGKKFKVREGISPNKD